MGGTVEREQPNDAFARLVVPELETLLRAARGIVTRPADAEDLVQDTLVRAFRSIDTFDGEHPRAWLLTILRNAHVNQHRRRRPVLLGPGEVVEEGAAPGADAAVDELFDEAVERALQDLPGRYRAVIDLVDIAGLSYGEAAIVLDVPVGTVMSRLSRARRKIRDQLRQIPSSTAPGGTP